MYDTDPALIAAFRELSGLAIDKPATFEDLAALGRARGHVEHLLRSCAAQLKANPGTADAFSALSYAIDSSEQHSATKPPVPQRSAAHRVARLYPSAVAQPRAPRQPQVRAPYGAGVDPHDGHVDSFWQAFCDVFVWDFLPLDFLHVLYDHWMHARHPEETVLSRGALTRRLKLVLPANGEWVYLRSRPGTLMQSREPLTELVPNWRLESTSYAVYGMRRASTMKPAQGIKHLRPRDDREAA